MVKVTGREGPVDCIVSSACGGAEDVEVGNQRLSGQFDVASE